MSVIARDVLSVFRLRIGVVIAVSALAGLSVTLLTGYAGMARAEQPSRALDEVAALQISQNAIGRIIQDHAFTDVRHQQVQISDYYGNPLIVNLIYTSCHHTCPLVVQTLAHAVDIARDAIGPDSFNVITVGFDSRADTPERMRRFARSQGIDLPNWRFLSADVQTIDALAADLGFVFRPSPRGFDHLAQTTVIDEEGRIYRQIYGGAFAPQALVEPLKSMALRQFGSLGTVAGLVNRVRLFCTVYDPNSERYRFDYSILIGGLIGGGSLAAIAIVLIRAWRRRPTGET